MHRSGSQSYSSPCSVLASSKYNTQLSPRKNQTLFLAPSSHGLQRVSQRVLPDVSSCWPLHIRPAWGGSWPCVPLQPVVLWPRAEVSWSLLSRHLSRPGYTLATRNVVSQDRT